MGNQIQKDLKSQFPEKLLNVKRPKSRSSSRSVVPSISSDKFTVDKFIKIFETELGKENIYLVIREPDYPKQFINDLLCFFELLPIRRELKDSIDPFQLGNNVKLESSMYKLIFKFTNYLPVKFPKDLGDRLNQLSEQIFDKYYGEIAELIECKIEGFESIVDDLYHYLVMRTENVMKRYWEERYGPDSIVIGGLTRNGLL